MLRTFVEIGMLSVVYRQWLISTCRGCGSPCKANRQRLGATQSQKQEVYALPVPGAGGFDAAQVAHTRTWGRTWPHVAAYDPFRRKNGRPAVASSRQRSHFGFPRCILTVCLLASETGAFAPPTPNRPTFVFSHRISLNVLGCFDWWSGCGAFTFRPCVSNV